MLQRRDLYQFGIYILDSAQGVLRGPDGIVGLPPKALATLLVLVEERGEVVSKQQLMDRVWPDSFVEGGNLSQNIFLLRRELGKTAEGAEYIQTLAKRGYRLAVPVALVEPALAPALPPVVVQAERTRWALWLGVALLLLAVGGVLARGLYNGQPRLSEYVQITHDGLVKRGNLQASAGPNAALFTDGARVYFTVGSSDSMAIAEVSATGGETARLALPFADPQLLDLSRLHSELLISSHADGAAVASLWSVPVPAGQARPLNGLAGWDAAWSPDGTLIAFTRGRDLSVAKADGTNARKLATLPGTAWMPRWSPDGTRLRLTVYDTQESGDSIWEVASGGGEPHQLHLRWPTHEPRSVCCGSWTPDGKQFVFQATAGDRSDIWTIADRPRWLPQQTEPVQLTSGQLSSLAPVLSPDGRKLFVIGQQVKGELQRWDEGSHEFVSYLGGQSMDFASFSRDGAWVTWVQYPERTLWRSRADGSERRQLTFSPLHAMMPRWSPDGSQIVFYAGGGGGHQRAYLVPAAGGTPQPLPGGAGKEMLPNWSPDGSTILFSEFPFFAPAAEAVTLHRLDLQTHRSTVIPGSKGLFAAQWSPDGRWIAALEVHGAGIHLLDTASGRWTQVATGGGSLNWSRDSKKLYFLRAGDSPAVMSFAPADGHIAEVASLKDVRQAGQLAGISFGLTPQDVPFVLRDIGAQEIYSLKWQAP